MHSQSPLQGQCFCNLAITFSRVQTIKMLTQTHDLLSHFQIKIEGKSPEMFAVVT